MRPLTWPALAICLFLGTWCAAQEAATELARLPVREAYVFKDGHAFITRRGEVTLDAEGRVRIGDLPTPVLGTFWPTVLEDDCRIEAVTASKETIPGTKTAANLRELLRVNVGREVRVIDTQGDIIRGVVQKLEPSEGDGASNAGYVLLKDGSETRAFDLGRVRDLIFVGDYTTTVARSKKENVLEIKVAGKDIRAGRKVTVSLSWIESGLRWIPSYRVDTDGEGKAKIKLQASLMNDLVDLDQAAVHLVVGVPNFRFHDVKDPISLHAVAQQTAAAGRRTPGFRGDHRSLASNFITTQVAGGYVTPDAGAGAGAELAGSELEDLFLYDFGSVSLKKGSRMAKAVSEFELEYEDVYVLDLGLFPPESALRSMNANQRKPMLEKPKAEHRLRFSNKQSSPLTTAPALIMRKGQVMAQGLMTYTPPGARVDLAVTAAINIQVHYEEDETKRTPNAAVFDGSKFNLIETEGRLKLNNRSKKTVSLEVKKRVLGDVSKISSGGSARQLGAFEITGGHGVLPTWWWNYSWPYWWLRINGISELNWTIELEPGSERELKAEWSYYWRR